LAGGERFVKTGVATHGGRHMRRFPRLLLAAFPFLMAGLLDGLAFTPPCGAVTEGDRTPPIGDFAAARGRPSKKALPVIPVVKTWEELLKQPSLDLGGGVKVRLGIEATRCPRWSGVLLYACTEGYDDMTYRAVNRDRLGPLGLGPLRRAVARRQEEVPVQSTGGRGGGQAAPPLRSPSADRPARGVPGHRP
jgi:hypothetical protein